MIHTEKLESLCHINSGGTPSRGVSEYYGGKIPWAKIGDIEKSNGIINSTEEYITESGLESIGNRIFPKGTLLFAMYGSVGKVAFSGIELSTNQAILGIRLKSEANEKLDLQYLKCWFQVNLLLFKSRAVGGILKNLSATIVKDFDIPLPSLIDQKRIAKVLLECDALIQKRKESIGLLDELLRSTFLEMFWKKNPQFENWEVKSVEEYALPKKGSMRTGPFGSDLLHSEFADEGEVRVIGIDNVVNNVFEWGKPKYITFEKYKSLERYRVFPGDVLISIMATNGRSAVVPDDIPVSINTKHLATISLDKSQILPFYLKYAFQYHPSILNQLSKSIKGAIMDGLNLTIIKQLRLPRPALSLQEEFTELVKKNLILKKLLRESLKELENLYGSISQRAFNGELDLNKVDISDMEDSKEKDLDEVKGNFTEKQFEELENSFEHILPTGEVPSNRNTDIRNMSIRQYLQLPEYDETTDGIEFFHMDKDYFYQFILTKGFSDRTFTLPELERYARKYIVRGTGFEFTYESWKTIIFRFIGAKQPMIEQIFDEETKSIELKLTDEAFKV